YFSWPGAVLNGPRRSIPHLINGHGVVIELSSVGGALCISPWLFLLNVVLQCRHELLKERLMLPAKHLRRGIEIPLLYSHPSMTVWLLALLFIKVASDGSSDSFPLVIISIVGSIQVVISKVVEVVYTAIFLVIYGCCNVFYMKECVTPLGRVLANRARTSALVILGGLTLR
ncbi:hypothetical protein A2U01_0019850, partial [Trifolium medium]|nr:hypothetical protein [Trifolium medium]